MLAAALRLLPSLMMLVGAAGTLHLLLSHVMLVRKVVPAGTLHLLPSHMMFVSRDTCWHSMSGALPHVAREYNSE